MRSDKLKLSPPPAIQSVFTIWISLCDILRGSDIQIIGASMKRYATSKDKNIHRLMQPKAFGFLISTIVGLDTLAPR